MIVIDSVSKKFGPVWALQDMSLEFKAGDRIAIVGTNGSGKTTLLRSICGLLKFDGHILLSGFDVAKTPQLALANVAYMPQIAPPLEAPVHELVQAYCGLRGKSAVACAERSLRLGLDLNVVGRTRVRDLSGGMKQKLLASLALTAEAPILICDEPTANLDPAAREVFFSEVQTRSPDSVLILCSHRVDEVRHLVRRVVQMADGKVAGDTRMEAP